MAILALASACAETLGPGADESGSALEANNCEDADDGEFGDQDPAAVEAACIANDGAHCSAADFISRDAAICLAEAGGLEPGLEPWTVGLLYNVRYGQPVWDVSNLLERRGTWGEEGHWVAFAAESGERIEEGGWMTTE